MVQMRPRISLGFPSTISSAPMDSSLTCKENDNSCQKIFPLREKLIENCTLVWRNARHLLTFSILWTLIFPELGLPSLSPEIISSSRIKYLPSAKSVNRSLISIRLLLRKELTHLVNVFFCIESRSSCRARIRPFSKS